jgi:hypothetical protein
MHAVEALMNTATDAEADEDEVLRTMGVQFSLTGQDQDFIGNDQVMRTSHKRVTVNRLAFRTKQQPAIFRLRAEEQAPMTAAEQNEVLRAPSLPNREPVQTPSTGAGRPAPVDTDIDWVDD